MHAPVARSLLILPLLLCAATANAANGHDLYLQIVPRLEDVREQFRAACDSGQAPACDSLQSLDEVLGALEQTDAACQKGDTAACRELSVGVGVFMTGLRCQSGNAYACRQLEEIEALAPACDDGDSEACAQIEFALFGT